MYGLKAEWCNFILVVLYFEYKTQKNVIFKSLDGWIKPTWVIFLLKPIFWSRQHVGLRVCLVQINIKYYKYMNESFLVYYWKKVVIENY